MGENGYCLIVGDDESTCNDYCLIVEDDDSVRRLLSMRINLSYEIPEGCIIEAKNGKQAFDFCINNENIGIIFLDLKMPGYNGAWFLKKVYEKKEEEVFLNNTKIILYSASNLESIVKDEEELEKLEGIITDYLPKPCSIKKLKEIIDKHTKFGEKKSLAEYCTS